MLNRTTIPASLVKAAVSFLIACALSGCASLSSPWGSKLQEAQSLVDQILPEFKNVKRVSLQINRVPGYANATMFQKTCYVTIDGDYLSGLKSKSELAFALSHEIAHCDNGDVSFLFNIDIDTHQKEFAADRKAHEVMTKLGFDDLTTLKTEDLPLFFRESTAASKSHPSGSARRTALSTTRRGSGLSLIAPQSMER